MNAPHFARPCPSCSSARCEPAGDKDGYVLLQCRHCRHLFVSNLPSPEVLDEFYRRYSYDQILSEDLPQFVRDSVDRLVQSFAPYRRLGRLLDVGFGHGTILQAASAADWEAHGIETSSAAVEKATLRGLNNAVRGDFLSFPYPERSFDVVLMYEVVEHLPDVHPFIRRASSLLRPGGILYISTPNITGLSGRMLGASWSIVCPPEHLNLFSDVSLSHLLGSHGFANVDVRTESINPAELARFVRNRIGEVLKPRRRIETAPTPVDAAFRNGSAQRLNTWLTSTDITLLLKKVVNQALVTLRMGDSLKATAMRPA